jgi:large subunit ribosomal protein L10
MAVTKEQKKKIIDTLAQNLEGVQSVAFVGFNKMSVEHTTKMRNDLRNEGVGYQVVKKTLLRRVLDQKGFSGTLPEMDGNVAIAWSSTDLTAPARLVHGFRKGREDSLSIVGGVFEGRFMDAVEMNEIATIPSMLVLRGMFVNVINAPIQGFVSVLNQIAEKKA